MRLSERRRFVRRTHLVHSFAHIARNLAVMMMAHKPERFGSESTNPPVPVSGRLHYSYFGELTKLMRLVSDMFSELVPSGTKVWACLRERRSDGKYYTILRAGVYNASRAEHSVPLDKDSETMKKLRESYAEKKNCVMITGSARRAQEWEKMPNDDLGEDRCILMGAVLSKSWNGYEFDQPMFNWVLCVCADKDNAFDESHIPLMKFYNDVFSWLINSFIRHDAVLNRNSSGSTIEPSVIRRSETEPGEHSLPPGV